MSEKIAIVIFNMGGPDSVHSVRPFLRNLFSDPAIITLPYPFRMALAELISRGRNKIAQKNYALMGGKSPLVEESQKQADAVQKALQKALPEKHIKCFIAMRYWAPRIASVQTEIRAWGAEKIVLLPLYPQFSTTTTGTFFNAWDKTGKALPKALKIKTYAEDEDFIQAHVNKIISTFEQNYSPENTRLIMSAHGLPEKFIRAGDPYQQQIEKTCAAIAKKLPKTLGDMCIAYQSKVGRLQWIGPSTLDEIVRAGKDGKAALIVPVAFVSEHVETLVELDIDYRQKAKECGIKTYMRVPTLGVESSYIKCLSKQAQAALRECDG